MGHLLTEVLFETTIMVTETGSSKSGDLGRQVTHLLKNPSSKSSRNIIVEVISVKRNVN